MPPFSETEDGVQLSDTVGFVAVASVNSNVVTCSAASVPLVTESMATMMVSLPSVVVSDIPVIIQLVEVAPAAMGWVVLSLR